MSAGLADQLNTAGDIISRFGLTSLQPALKACEALSGDTSLIDVAVLGQFKSGKSSLLNAILGEAVFPVGAVPVTAVITRAEAGRQRVVRVAYQDGSVEEVVPSRLCEFVTEGQNPRNCRQVAEVIAITPAMDDWPGIRLVDTPGLGSVLAHATETTRAWMPNVAAALVTVSAERPLSDADRRLVAEARQIAPRVVVMLTKVDLLTEAERAEVIAFLDKALRESFGATVPVLPFSTRSETARWLGQLREAVLLPVVRDVAGERRAALSLKLAALVRTCQGYLTVGLRAAERAEADRERLRAAVLNESVNAGVIRDELRLAEERVRDATRPAFEQAFLAQRGAVQQRVADALRAELQTWAGNLARQTRQYETWMADRLTAELTPLSQDADALAVDLLAQAETRLRRGIEAFRDRLSRNIAEATGIVVSPATWEAKRPQVAVVPVAVSRTFMTHWDLLWWLLPMWLVGGLFRRHVLGRVPWEVEKNLIRLAGDWASAADAAVIDLRTQAAAWVDTELTTLDRLLGQKPTEMNGFCEALGRLEELGVPQTA
jgi:GTP-binding protein EngB required for normal cell division